MKLGIYFSDSQLFHIVFCFFFHLSCQTVRNILCDWNVTNENVSKLSEHLYSSKDKYKLENPLLIMQKNKKGWVLKLQVDINKKMRLVQCLSRAKAIIVTTQSKEINLSLVPTFARE